MKVLVLGGTGAIGVHLVQLLSRREIKTVVTSRMYREATENVQYIQGNAKDLVFLRKILQKQWDAIIDFMTYTTPGFKERVHLLLAGTSQYVFLSSARVYADSEKLITEKTSRLLDVTQDEEFYATDEYSLAKARQEDILINSGSKNWTIIRPYITYSENRLQLGILEKEEWLYRALHGRKIVFSKDINSKRTTLTYGLDVSRGIASIIGKSEIFGSTFHITVKNQSSKTWCEIMEIYLSVLEEYLGAKPEVLFQNLDMFMEFRPKKSKYQIIYDRLYNRQFDCTRISQYVDIDSFVKPEIGLTNCLKAFLKNPHFKPINWQMEAKRDKQSGERTPFKEINGIKQKMKYLFYRYLN